MSQYPVQYDRFWSAPKPRLLPPLKSELAVSIILHRNDRIYCTFAIVSSRPFDYRRWQDDKCIRDTNGKWTHGWVQTKYAEQKQASAPD